jgi:hypothetical protein
MNRLAGIGRQAAVVLAASLVAFLGWAQGAQAQGYSVYADCNRSDGWNAQGDDNYGAYRDCGGGWLGGMRTLVAPHGDGRVANGSAAYSFSAPGGTKIVGLQWSGNKYHGVSSAGWLGGGWAFRTGMFGDGFRNIDGEADCYTYNYGACFSGAASDPNAKSIPDHHVGGLNESVDRLAAGLGVGGIEPRRRTRRANKWARRFRVRRQRPLLSRVWHRALRSRHSGLASTRNHGLLHRPVHPLGHDPHQPRPAAARPRQRRRSGR